jgi:hypothetical protein
LAIFSIICFSPFLDLAFVPRGAAASRAFEANALHGGGRRLSVRAVKAAGFAFIGAQRRALTGEAEGSGAEFSQEGIRVRIVCRSFELRCLRTEALDRKCSAILQRWEALCGLHPTSKQEHAKRARRDVRRAAQGAVEVSQDPGKVQNLKLRAISVACTKADSPRA